MNGTVEEPVNSAVIAVTAKKCSIFWSTAPRFSRCRFSNIQNEKHCITNNTICQAFSLSGDESWNDRDASQIRSFW